MKIKIHTHTKKYKSSDAPPIEILTAEFCEKVLSTDIQIVAIRNHNHFDLNQFEEIESGLNDEAQVWSGIELDTVECGPAL